MNWRLGGSETRRVAVLAGCGCDPSASSPSRTCSPDVRAPSAALGLGGGLLTAGLAARVSLTRATAAAAAPIREGKRSTAVPVGLVPAAIRPIAPKMAIPVRPLASRRSRQDPDSGGEQRKDDKHADLEHELVVGAELPDGEVLYRWRAQVDGQLSRRHHRRSDRAGKSAHQVTDAYADGAGQQASYDAADWHVLRKGHTCYSYQRRPRFGRRHPPSRPGPRQRIRNVGMTQGRWQQPAGTNSSRAPADGPRQDWTI